MYRELNFQKLLGYIISHHTLTGAYARVRHGGLAPPPHPQWLHNSPHSVRRGHPEQSAENSGKPLGGRGSARTPLGELTALSYTDMEPALNL